MEIMNHHCENAVFDLQNKVLKMPKYLFIENIKNIIMHTACCYIWKKNNKNASACSNALYICNYKKTSFPKSTNYYFFQHDICKFFYKPLQFDELCRCWTKSLLVHVIWFPLFIIIQSVLRINSTKISFLPPTCFRIYSYFLYWL